MTQFYTVATLSCETGNCRDFPTRR